MRTISKVAGLTAVIIVAACGKDAKKTANADLARDLGLANQQAAKLYAPTETAPPQVAGKSTIGRIHAPEVKAVKGDGPAVIASETGTVPVVGEAMVATTTDVPPMTTVSAATVTTPTVEAMPAVPRPVPASSGGYGDMGGDMASGPVLRGPQVVIRGGGVGDDDHCEPPGIRRGAGGMTMGGIYIPSGPVLVNRPTPTGVASAPGGPIARPGATGGGVQRRGRGGL